MEAGKKIKNFLAPPPQKKAVFAYPKRPMSCCIYKLNEDFVCGISGTRWKTSREAWICVKKHLGELISPPGHYRGLVITYSCIFCSRAYPQIEDSLLCTTYCLEKRKKDLPAFIYFAVLRFVEKMQTIQNESRQPPLLRIKKKVRIPHYYTMGMRYRIVTVEPEVNEDRPQPYNRSRKKPASEFDNRINFLDEESADPNKKGDNKTAAAAPTAASASAGTTATPAAAAGSTTTAETPPTATDATSSPAPGNTIAAETAPTATANTVPTTPSPAETTATPAGAAPTAEAATPSPATAAETTPATAATSSPAAEAPPPAAEAPPPAAAATASSAQTAQTPSTTPPAGNTTAEAK